MDSPTVSPATGSPKARVWSYGPGDTGISSIGTPSTHDVEDFQRPTTSGQPGLEAVNPEQASGIPVLAWSLPQRGTSWFDHETHSGKEVIPENQFGTVESRYSVNNLGAYGDDSKEIVTPASSTRRRRPLWPLICVGIFLVVLALGLGLGLGLTKKK
jgi:hypothetical protein